MDGVETTRRVMRSDENEKQASPTSLHSHAQNDLILAIILRYVSFSQDSTPKDRAQRVFERAWDKQDFPMLLSVSASSDAWSIIRSYPEDKDVVTARSVRVIYNFLW